MIYEAFRFLWSLFIFTMLVFCIWCLRITQRNIYRGNKKLSGLYFNIGTIVELKSYDFFIINRNNVRNPFMMRVYRVSFTMDNCYKYDPSFHTCMTSLINKAVETEKIEIEDEINRLAINNGLVPVIKIKNF